MAFILCIDTATEICSVALFDGINLVSINEISEGNMHASELTTLISKTVGDGGITLQQLNAICISKGPGSYTGLRVGVSTAKGLCYGLNIPLIAINTLQSLASVYMQNTPNNTHLICPMIDARRMEVFTAMYQPNLAENSATEAKIIDEESYLTELNNSVIVFIGNGAQKCKLTITHTNAIFVDGIFCSAKGLGALAYPKFTKNEFENIAYFEPFYLKDFVATTPKKK